MATSAVRLISAWGVLVTMTLIGFAVAGLHKPGIGFVAVMTLAGLKAQLVLRVYMDLGSISIAWRRIFDLLIIVTVLLVTGLSLTTFLA